MKYNLLVTLLIIQLTGFSQVRTSSVVLGKGITVIGIIEPFNIKKHKLDTCKDDNGNKYICKIDNKAWFGLDQGLELPETQLRSLQLKIQNTIVHLDVTGMYNPTFSPGLSKDQFKIKKTGTGYILYSFFSDGGGTYTVHWKITNNTSKRILISTNEEDFSWQSQN